MRRFTRSVLWIMLMVSLAAPLAAQHGDSGRRGGCPPNCPMDKWQEIVGNMENLRLFKLLEAIDLTEEQSTQFMPIFHSFRKDAKKLHDDRRELVESLRSFLNTGGSDEQIKSELAKLKQNRLQIDARQDEFFVECEKVLTTPQLARLVIFEERFEREALETLREFRRPGGHQSSQEPQEKP